MIFKTGDTVTIADTDATRNHHRVSRMIGNTYVVSGSYVKHNVVYYTFEGEFDLGISAAGLELADNIIINDKELSDLFVL